MTKLYDVIIVGAGPAGSTAASILADAGQDVLVLEKENFPRPHIGESLLPVGTGVLERLGIQMPKDTFLFKRGAQFICERSGQHLTISFDEAFPGPPRHAWQVDRASFDLLLRDRARAAGAQVLHGAHVLEVECTSEWVTVRTRNGEIYRTRYLIDATGQGRLMARSAKAVEPLRDFGLAASFQHFSGVDMRRLGEHGDIRIMMHEDGWAWVIPLPKNRLSIGVVTRNKGATTKFVERFVSTSPLAQHWTVGAHPSEPQLIGNYSYRNGAAYGARYACIGDAACFLDPVFSSGVSLALVSAERVSQTLLTALQSNDESQKDLMLPISNDMQNAYRAFSSLIRRFYHTKMVDNLFFGSTEGAAFRRGIVSVLAGDVWRTDNPFQDMLERARRVKSPAVTSA